MKETSQTTFKVLVASHAGMVRRIASAREREVTAIDDLTQEIWLAVWRGMPRIETARSPKAYIARLAHNISVDHVRRAVRRPIIPLDDRQHLTLAVGEATAESHARLEHLVEAVRNLAEPLKAVATLYLEDMSVGEIAEAIGISPANASVRLHRARSALRQALESEDER